MWISFIQGARRHVYELGYRKIFWGKQTFSIEAILLTCSDELIHVGRWQVVRTFTDPRYIYQVSYLASRFKNTNIPAVYIVSQLYNEVTAVPCKLLLHTAIRSRPFDGTPIRSFRFSVWGCKGSQRLNLSVSLAEMRPSRSGSLSTVNLADTWQHSPSPTILQSEGFVNWFTYQCNFKKLHSETYLSLKHLEEVTKTQQHGIMQK